MFLKIYRIDRFISKDQNSESCCYTGSTERKRNRKTSKMSTTQRNIRKWSPLVSSLIRTIFRFKSTQTVSNCSIHPSIRCGLCIYGLMSYHQFCENQGIIEFWLDCGLGIRNRSCLLFCNHLPTH